MSTCKICRICNIEKPLTDFYVRKANRDGRYGACKECIKLTSKRNAPNRKEPKSTNDVRNLLNSLGIPVVTGRSGGFPYLDLLAWGCVPIEAKSGSYTKGRFLIVFSPGQQQNGWQDGLLIICLCKCSNGQTRVFIIPGNSKIVNNKAGFTISLDSKHGLSKWKEISIFEDAFHLIEDERIRQSNLLRKYTQKLAKECDL